MLRRDAQRIKMAVRWVERQGIGPHGASRARHGGGGGTAVLSCVVKSIPSENNRVVVTMSDGTDVDVYAPVYAETGLIVISLAAATVVPVLTPGTRVLVATGVNEAGESMLELVRPTLMDTC